MQNILYNLDILNGLFTEKDFEFLKSSTSCSSKIKEQLHSATEKRKKIVEYISNFNNTLLKKQNINSEDSLTSAEHAFKNINTIIVNLSNLKESLESMEQDILKLIIKKETTSSTDETLTNNISEIKNKINNFDILHNDVEKINFSKNISVDMFFEHYYNTDNDNLNILANIEPEQTSNSKPTDNIITEDKNINILVSDNEQIKDNYVLRISEKNNKVYLPYSKSEILDFLKTYPDVYKNYNHVIKREYVADLSFYTRHPVLSRFRETYSLIRNREMKSVVDAFKRAVDLMFRYEINPAIIAGLKSENQLDLFLDCLDRNDLENFKPFKIIFEVNPI